MSSVHVSPLSTYLSIFAALMVLSAITVGAAFVDLGSLNPVVALDIAGLKATLVILYFMHVKWSQILTKLAVVVAVIFLLILLLLTATDYTSRNWLPDQPGWEKHQVLR